MNELDLRQQQDLMQAFALSIEFVEKISAATLKINKQLEFFALLK